MSEIWNESDLERFKSLQKLSYKIVQETESELQIGMSEKDASEIMLKKFHEHGVKRFFHRPFAWFGDRSMFKGFSKPFDIKKLMLPSFKNPLPHFGYEFLPTKKVLEDNMPVILDVAPVMDELACDIGYAFYKGENELHQKALEYLKKQRLMILELVNQKKSIHEIYETTQKDLLENGYTNCHGFYPLGVLGHKIGRLPVKKLPSFSIMGFEPASYAYFLSHLSKRHEPFLKEDVDAPLSEGLWAIEPHIGFQDFGVKFEEIMVVTKDLAYWLDDELPHV